VQSQVEVAQDDSQLARFAQSVWLAQLVISAQQAPLMQAPHVVSVGWLTHVMAAASLPPPPLPSPTAASMLAPPPSAATL
jgi:hypothetical protein